jgi:hypothetical protein
MSTTRRGLGRGLDALIPINPNTKKEDSEDRIIESKSENKSKVETKATTKSTTKAATKTATKSTSKGATKTTTKNADSKTSKTKQTASKGQTKKEAAKPEVKEVIKEVEIVKEVVKEIPKDTYLKVSEIEPNREQPKKLWKNWRNLLNSMVLFSHWWFKREVTIMKSLQGKDVGELQNLQKLKRFLL